ncbi:hypothetical protein SAMN05444280_1512 [Tangfeifania diversioriginum]|uniref:Uncharacterized protein n=1 Tax=Tangfeifania diversioriginum TaxID=1168035 RepID=A0A1M6P2H5_9BACT|nr:hypothetical protein SAMN05444280_1512 [Tangfeifania diversioriginum]
MALTKLNHNACSLADGEPVTLRFADKIGDIPTATTEIFFRMLCKHRDTKKGLNCKSTI